MSMLYLFARIAGTAIAVRTDEIEAVVRLKDISSVPGVPPHVAGLSALRSRVLTVVDAAMLIIGQETARPGNSGAGHFAIICDVGGHSYGLLVDGVDDIAAVDHAPLPLCGRVDAAWEAHVQAVIEKDGHSHFILSVAHLLGGILMAQAA